MNHFCSNSEHLSTDNTDWKKQSALNLHSLYADTKNAGLKHLKQPVESQGATPLAVLSVLNLHSLYQPAGGDSTGCKRSLTAYEKMILLLS